MKKTTLLSLFTASAIVATTAGTYAAWDTLTATSTGNVTFRNPVTVSAENISGFTSSTALDVLPVYTGVATFTASDLSKDKAGAMTFAVTVLDTTNSDTDVTENVTTETIDTYADNKHTVTVKVTPKDDHKDLAGRPLTVKVTATLKEPSN